MSLPPAMSRARRLQITLAAALVAAVVDAGSHWFPQRSHSDLDAFLVAAQAWRHGVNPYTVAGPGLAYDWPFPFVYPFPAVLVALPFSFLLLPDFWFAACGTALFVWGITSQGRFRYATWALASSAFMVVVRTSQWSALITGAALIPAAGFLLICKPNIGAALWAAFPSAAAAIGGIAFGLLSLALYPDWPVEWLTRIPAMTHVRAPVTFWGGPLILLALLEWRSWQARLLVAMACVPQTPDLYDALPLFLIPQTHAEAMMLVGLSWLALDIRSFLPPPTDYPAFIFASGQSIMVLMYLPCLFMVLRRRVAAFALLTKRSGRSGRLISP